VTTGFGDLVDAGVLVIGLSVADKDALLTALAEIAARASGQPAALILERVSEREALGSTGFGHGTAIPHARIAGLSHVTAVLARLSCAIDYGALDGADVDMAVLLLSPEAAGADHLKALARISRALRDPATLAAMRAADDAAALRAAIDAVPHAAALRSHGQRAA
jgi:PTS system nitrogen regulatory IIA component